MDAETHAAFNSLRDHVQRRFDDVDQRFDQVDRRFEQVDQRLDETRREFHVVEEGLRGEIRLLAEAFSLRCDRLETTLRDEIVRSHDDLAALIRSAYIDLDRRVTALERSGDSA